MKDIITREETINHPIEKVWNAISKAEEISKWFIKADFKAEAGTPYTFIASEEKGCITINGEVKEANPYKLVYTWIVEGTDVVTTVKWELKPEGEVTKLHLEHSGIANYPGDDAIKMFESFSGGWQGCVNQLQDYLKN
ncbi:MAG: SRPBCC family protein [Vicingaceae bacterium]